MKPLVCPICKMYLSEDIDSWYCTECDYESPKKRGEFIWKKLETE